MYSSSTRRRVVAALAIGGLVATAAVSTADAGPNNNSAKKLTKAVTVDGVLAHLEAFQDIADANGDRAAGRAGYDASADYVVAQLEAAGYSPTVQEFEFAYTEDNSALTRTDPATSWAVGEFLRSNFDPNNPQGTATAPLEVVDYDSGSSGCEADDFADFTAGNIALIERGACAFTVKINNAQAAGASAVILSNNQPGLVSMIGDGTGITIPSVFVIDEVGNDLASTPGAEVTVTVQYSEEIRTTTNVFAETSAGLSDNVVMAGAHLDSVQDGAGINDNGTGSAALLETAIQMGKVKPNNQVRFAWWGAEEEGLLGSEYYVANLSDEEIADIALYLNFDMVGSPNYMFGVYDGDNSGGTAPDGFIPAGSAEIEDVFEDFYTANGHPYQDSEFSGRSDYGPFIAVGIPAGGLFTGAEVAKTAEEVALYGGVEGASFDPCYHDACDNLTGEGQDPAVYDQLNAEYELVGNVNVHALDVNSDAIATAVITFAFDTSTVNGVSSPGKSHGNSNKHEAHGHAEEAAA